MSTQVIVVGGGLAGLSAAHTVLERGGRVVLLDKQPFMGGNSTKATSGINGTPTRTQAGKNIPDNATIFERDTAISAAGGADVPAPPLTKVLTGHSASAVEWLIDAFGLDLSLVSRLGGHSHPRTHRGKERFPGMTITMALMEKLETISKTGKAKILTKANVTKLITGPNGDVTGVEYEKDGQKLEEHGPVIIATGGFAADFSETGILKKVRPDLLHLPTTNGEHCTGDGITMATQVGGDTVDLDHVQVHPTGLVHPDEPDAKIKFLAAEALRGVGGILLDREGNRFCNELGRRDYVTGEMWKNDKAPYYLILNGGASKEIEWHTKHYAGRGLMKKYDSGAALAAKMGISVNKLRSSFDKYNKCADTKECPYGKKFFDNAPFDVADEFNVSIVTPVVHYCMGGLKVSTDAEVQNGGGAVSGLFAAGEVVGGIHGKNRLGGNSLLDCVVFGRVSGATASKYLLEQILKNGTGPEKRLAVLASHLQGPSVQASIEISPNDNRVSMSVSWPESNPGSSTIVPSGTSAGKSNSETTKSDTEKVENTVQKSGSFTAEEVAKHNTENDCWVIVNGKVLDVTSFLADHPGGKKAIMLYAGKDATEEFNMLHTEDTVERYAPEVVIGDLSNS